MNRSDFDYRLKNVDACLRKHGRLFNSNEDKIEAIILGMQIDVTPDELKSIKVIDRKEEIHL